MYTNFLLNQVMTILSNLTVFNKKTAKGITKNPNDYPEDKDLLRKVMKIISDNEELTPQVEIFVDKIKGMVELLKQHQVPLDEHQIDIVLIDQTKQEFNESKQLVLTLKEEIYPLQ